MAGSNWATTPSIAPWEQNFNADDSSHVDKSRIPAPQAIKTLSKLDKPRRGALARLSVTPASMLGLARRTDVDENPVHVRIART